jgi:hypothetical protein
VLFDQGAPAPLRRALIGHIVQTAFERNWSTLKNGDLLDAAEGAGLAVLVTTDSNLCYQQNNERQQRDWQVLQALIEIHRATMELMLERPI